MSSEESMNGGSAEGIDEHGEGVRDAAADYRYESTFPNMLSIFAATSRHCT